MARADMDQALTDLAAEVTRDGDAVSSAVTLIQGIVAQLDAAAGDPAAVKALSASLKTQTDALAAAVAAGTPAAPPPA
jgi:hypothetical protein